VDCVIYERRKSRLESIGSWRESITKLELCVCGYVCLSRRLGLDLGLYRSGTTPSPVGSLNSFVASFVCFYFWYGSVVCGSWLSPPGNRFDSLKLQRPTGPVSHTHEQSPARQRHQCLPHACGACGHRLTCERFHHLPWVCCTMAIYHPVAPIASPALTCLAIAFSYGRTPS
jgi:hypothetical protein